MIDKNLLIISGPTAVGKSSLALKIAKQLDTEIISIDSVQIYKEFDIGSAKPDIASRSAISHHLIDCLDPREEMNAAKYAKLADVEIDRLIELGKTPLLVGGSNLYIKSLLYGLSSAPLSSGLAEEMYLRHSNQELYSLLNKKDPVRASQLNENDRVRILRALEIAQDSVLPSQINQAHGFNHPRYNALIIVIVAHREELLKQIKNRTSEMLSSGLLAETERITKKYGRGLPALKSIGYVQALEYMDGKLRSGELSEHIVQATRRYAKQQLTFWKNEPAKRGWKLLEPASKSSFLDLNDASSEASFIVPIFSFDELSQQLYPQSFSPGIRYLFMSNN